MLNLCFSIKTIIRSGRRQATWINSLWACSGSQLCATLYYSNELTVRLKNFQCFPPQLGRRWGGGKHAAHLTKSEARSTLISQCLKCLSPWQNISNWSEQVILTKMCILKNSHFVWVNIRFTSWNKRQTLKGNHSILDKKKRRADINARFQVFSSLWSSMDQTTNFSFMAIINSYW